jgi:hypothetical protein
MDLLKQVALDHREDRALLAVVAGLGRTRQHHGERQ